MHKYRNKWDVRHDQVSMRLFEIDQRLGYLEHKKRPEISYMSSPENKIAPADYAT